MTELDIHRIHDGDDDEAARQRQAAIVERLEHIGVDQVRAMLGHGLPNEWGPIITAWLKAKGARC
jgi:hypothetical protein